MKNKKNKIALLMKKCEECISELLKQGYTEEQIINEITTMTDKIKQGFKED